MRNIAVGVQGLDGVGTIMQVSQGIWSHTHIKLDAGKIKFGDEPVTDDEDKLGVGVEISVSTKITKDGLLEAYIKAEANYPFLDPSLATRQAEAGLRLNNIFGLGAPLTLEFSRGYDPSREGADDPQDRLPRNFWGLTLSYEIRN